MKLCLISDDVWLAQLCRETLRGLPTDQWEFQCVPPDRPPQLADLCIWDFHPDQPLPAFALPLNDHCHAFVMAAEHLGVLHQRFPGLAASVLVKPVEPSAFDDFLQRAICRVNLFSALSHCDTGGPHRGDRDDLLQSLLFAGFRVQQGHVDRINFLSRALHDFRAPLTAVAGYCGLLLDQLLGPLSAEQIETLRRMQRSLKRLSRLSTIMFHLSLGHTEDRQPALEHGDIGECVDQAVYEITPLAEPKHIELTVHVTPPPEALRFDPYQIQQVLVNLLENACKYTPEHGFIEVTGYSVSWRPVDGGSEPSARVLRGYRIDVCDSGPGIPRERLATIFEQGAALSGSQDRSGTGLGLATCRLIMAAHRGEIFAESSTQGATFSFVLPFAEPEPLGGVPTPPMAWAGLEHIGG